MTIAIAVPDKEININESHILPIILNAHADRFVKQRNSELIGNVSYNFGWSVTVGCLVFEFEIRHKPYGTDSVLSFISRHIPKSNESLDIFLLRVLKNITEDV